MRLQVYGELSKNAVYGEVDTLPSGILECGPGSQR
jgi:hypothetical protein